MYKIRVPNNNKAERRYIIEVVFAEFLNVKFEIEFNDDIDVYEIIISETKKIIIKDCFFRHYPVDLSYLKSKAIPKRIIYGHNRFVQGDDIPIIYGDAEIEESNGVITCGIDIFASSYYMLSRWEEFVIEDRDIHKRFPATKSLAFKADFLNRPVVNEYVFMLLNMLRYLDEAYISINQGFKFQITHDIDDVRYWKKGKSFIKNVAHTLLREKNLLQTISDSYCYLLTKAGSKKDPYHCFNKIMDTSDKFGLKSHFYFMNGGSSQLYENRYKLKDVDKIINDIVQRGHYIGYHASYNSYINLSMFKEEKAGIEKCVETEINEGRQHYLRFSVPETWQVWDDAGMKYDSTCGFAEMIGFRSGTGNDYTTFNILTQKKLNVKERPLIIMDDTLFGYNNFSIIKAINKTKEIIDVCKKYNTKCTHLTHNTYFRFKGFYKYYTTVLEYVTKS
jgi:hypothetical protein